MTQWGTDLHSQGEILGSLLQNKVQQITALRILISKQTPGTVPPA